MPTDRLLQHSDACLFVAVLKLEVSRLLVQLIQFIKTRRTLTFHEMLNLIFANFWKSFVEIEVGVALFNNFLVSLLKVLGQHYISVFAHCLHTRFLTDSLNVSG